mgnify:FL=1
MDRAGVLAPWSGTIEYTFRVLLRAFDGSLRACRGLIFLPKIKS